MAAFAGIRYSHVLVAAGLNANPLTHQHQVGFYAAHQANSNVGVSDGFVAGFETAIGLAAGTYAQALPKLVAFAVGGFSGGAGASCVRSWNFSAVDQTYATHNAVLAMWDATFTGNHFIYYTGSRPTTLAGGDLIGPAEIYRSIDTSYVRLAGGNAGGGGANLLLFGASHATNANKAQLNASAGFAFFGPSTFSSTVGITGAVTLSTYLAGIEETAPAAPAANGYRLYAEDNGSGKTRLMVIFATGAAQQLAIQP